ncbi:hypothetical protein [Sinorhizobium fredii]|uniref:hypothetical protein n=1 Tax=Rhizobium fredii TaxID=380 RepID=UPI0035129D39
MGIKDVCSQIPNLGVARSNRAGITIPLFSRKQDPTAIRPDLAGLTLLIVLPL